MSEPESVGLPAGGKSTYSSTTDVESTALHASDADPHAPITSSNAKSVQRLTIAVAILAVVSIVLTITNIALIYDANSSGDSSGPSKTTLTCEVAIMGAGPSGLFISESLARHGHQVCVFEKENRYGGRVFDYWFPQMPNSEPVGLGAWRIDRNHTDVWALVKRFNITTRPWQVKSTYFEARGQTLQPELVVKARAWPSLMTGPYANYTAAMYSSMLANDQYFIDKWNNYYDMESFVCNELGVETWNYMVARSHTEGFLLQDPYQYFDPSGGDLKSGVHFRPLRGMSSITSALYHAAVQGGVNFYFNERVQSVNQGQVHSYAMETQNYILNPQKIVLAAPQTAISNLTGNLIDAITSQPIFQSSYPTVVFKSALLFATAWWEPQLQPLQAYYTDSTCLSFIVSYIDRGPNGEAMLHTSYEYGSCAASGEWAVKLEYLSGPELAVDVINQLKVLFPGRTIPQPLGWVFQLWKDGGWFNQKLNSGFYEDDIANWAGAPFAGTNFAAAGSDVFLSGDMYSPIWAWVEGAVLAGKRTLKNWAGESSSDTITQSQFD